jgi:hypothetical protein
LCSWKMEAAKAMTYIVLADSTLEEEEESMN